MDNQSYLMKVFNHFLGYGSLDSKTICFGIEEHGSKINDECEEFRFEAYLEKYNSSNVNDFFIMDDVDFNFFYEKCADKNKRKKDQSESKKSIFYKFCSCINDNYGNKKSLICNLYPLWKNSTSIPIYDNKTQTDFGVKHFSDWYDKYYKVREDVLSSFFNFLISTGNSYKIFTFGEANSFIFLFNSILQMGILDIKAPKIFSSTGRNRKYWQFSYKNLEVFVLYHPSHKWINENQLNEILSNIIK